jgi:hypothetical protein
MIAKVFLRLVQCGGIGDALAALFTRKGIDDEMGRADQTCVHCGRRLHGNQCIHERFVDMTTKLTERLWQDTVSLRARRLVLLEATGVHHRKVGPQAVANILIGSAQFMFEQLQSQQYPDRNRGSSTRGAFGEACIKTVLDGSHQSRPRKGVSPLANRMGVRDKVRDVQAWSSATQPMLKEANKAHRVLSSWKRGREPRIRRPAQPHKLQ